MTNLTNGQRRRRIKVPAEAVRTREAILADAVVGKGHVWEVCSNCGGSGDYPSGCTPPGRCRFYCWAWAIDGGPPIGRLVDREPKYYGRRPVPIDKYVKRAQAADRRAYRDAIIWEEDRPERERLEAERLAAEEARRVEREQREAERLAILAERRHVGTVGERLTMEGVRVDFRQWYDNNWGGSCLLRFRDADGNAVVWWTGSPPDDAREGAIVTLTATVKSHGTYKDEAQTTVTRAKVHVTEPAPVEAAEEVAA